MAAQSAHISLGYLGLVPFLALTGTTLIANPAWAMTCFLLYSGSIAAFMAGSLWQPNKNNGYQALFIALPLTSAPLLVFTHSEIQISWLMLVFVFLFFIEKTLPSYQQHTKEYKDMRGKLTATVVFCHLLQLVSNLYTH